MKHEWILLSDLIFLDTWLECFPWQDAINGSASAWNDDEEEEEWEYGAFIIGTSHTHSRWEYIITRCRTRVDSTELRASPSGPLRPIQHNKVLLQSSVIVAEIPKGSVRLFPSPSHPASLCLSRSLSFAVFTFFFSCILLAAHIPLLLIIFCCFSMHDTGLCFSFFLPASACWGKRVPLRASTLWSCRHLILFIFTSQSSSLFLLVPSASLMYLSCLFLPSLSLSCRWLTCYKSSQISLLLSFLQCISIGTQRNKFLNQWKRSAMTEMRRQQFYNDE